MQTKNYILYFKKIASNLLELGVVTSPGDDVALSEIQCMFLNVYSHDTHCG